MEAFHTVFESTRCWENKLIHCSEILLVGENIFNMICLTHIAQSVIMDNPLGVSVAWRMLARDGTQAHSQMSLDNFTQEIHMTKFKQNYTSDPGKINKSVRHSMCVFTYGHNAEGTTAPSHNWHTSITLIWINPKTKL